MFRTVRFFFSLYLNTVQHCTKKEIMTCFDVVLLKTLPLHIQKKIALYCTELVDYIHIRYTYTKLHKYIPLSLSSLSLTTVQALMCSIRYFFENSDYEKYTSLQVTRLLNNYRFIVPWNECLSKQYIHPLDVFVAIVACGTSIGTKSVHNAVHWTFKLVLKKRYNYIHFHEHKYITL